MAAVQGDRTTLVLQQQARMPLRDLAQFVEQPRRQPLDRVHDDDIRGRPELDQRAVDVEEEARVRGAQPGVEFVYPDHEPVSVGARRFAPESSFSARVDERNSSMPRSLPPLTSLRAFEAAARCLSFTRAARELHVTPAAISHQIRGLEQFLGVTLFQRNGRRPGTNGCRSREPRCRRSSADSFFDDGHLALQAACAGQGVALGRLACALDDLAHDRLVLPYPQVLELDLHYHLLVPRARLRDAVVARFRQWLLGEAREFRGVLAGHARAA